MQSQFIVFLFATILSLKPLTAIVEEVPSTSTTPTLNSTDLPNSQTESQFTETIVSKDNNTPIDPTTLTFDRDYSRDHHYSIEFPSTWEVPINQDESTLGAISERTSGDDNFRENILVGSFNLGKEMTLQEYFDGNLDYLKQKVKDLEIISTERITLDGHEAIQVTYVSIIDDHRYKTTQVFLIEGGRGFIITAIGLPEGYDRFSRVFDKIIKSFRFE